MAIDFLEGLDGSGKTFEAATQKILPALEKGRVVVTNISGMGTDVCQAKISEVTGIDQAKIKELIIPIDDDQVLYYYKHAPKGALVVIDEVQDFWPATNKELPRELRPFITRHRHHGWHIVLIGQDMMDVHAFWRRRVKTVFRFLNREAIGQANKYSWTSYAMSSDKKFTKITSGSAEYESKYFGIYNSSQSDDDESTSGRSGDARANVFSNKKLKYGIPITFLVCFFAFKYIAGIFSGDNEIIKTTQQEQQAEAPPIGGATAPSTVDRLVSTVPVEAVPAVYQEPPPPPDTRTTNQKMLDELFENRARLSALMIAADGRTEAIIEFYDKSFHIQDRFLLSQLEALGVVYEISQVGISIEFNDKQFVVTDFPLDPMGRVSTRKIEAANSF